MPIIPNKKSHAKSTTQKPVFSKVCKYCLPQMLTITIIPFVLVIISLILATINAITAGEIIAHYIAFPLALCVPLFHTVKMIYALKGAFPRKTNDSHQVALSVHFCYCLSTMLLIILFIISCNLYSAFPLNFRGAAYMRDMTASSSGAMFILYSTVFIFYTFISIMILASYFIGDRSNVKFKFTLSCIVFFAIYVIFLIFLILCYFTSTFIDITALENIQIAQSLFNSSMLCAFVTFDVLAVLTIPILYFINIKFLKKELEL